jgi:hypothetical protein
MHAAILLLQLRGQDHTSQNWYESLDSHHHTTLIPQRKDVKASRNLGIPGNLPMQRVGCAKPWEWTTQNP